MSSNVENLLIEEGVYFVPKGKDLLVSCLNPEHDDSNPSMRIDRITGIFGCFSCGFKGNIFTYYGHARDHHTERVALMKKKISDIITSTEGYKMPEGYRPLNKSYRGLPKDFLKQYDAFFHDDNYPDRIVFPIRDVNGLIKAFIGRRLNSDAPPKYSIDPPEADVPLYPAKVKPVYGTIILVEGIFDALNLHHKGVTNAICCFGVNTISERNIKKKLIKYRMQGATRIVILFDGDKTGRKQAIDMKELISSKTDFSVETFTLPEDLDPGDMTQEQVDKMTKKLYKKDNNV